MASNQAGKCKLFIRHLPSILSNDDKFDLLKHFGAVEVVCMGRSSKMKDSAFADFNDETSASKALNRLHQLEVLGSRLVVEYAKKSHERLAAQNSHRMSPSRDKEDNFDDGIDRKDETDIQDKNGQAKKEILDGIAPKLGIKYKSNPNLRYLYPPPNTAILTNIAHTLACVPKFYVQVLHLMNRMNLPAPFGPVTPTPPSIGERHTNDNRISESSEESEMESDEEDKEKRARMNKLQKKSKPELQSKKRAKLKPTKGPLPKKLKSSSSVQQESVEEAFEQTDHQRRKIEFNLSDAITSIFDGGPPQMEIPSGSEKGSSVVEGFGKFEPQPDAPLDEPPDDATNMEENDDFITLKELEANRMSQKELSTTSALKNYSVGEVTSRLYVKNLAKQVEEKDLQYIFGRYVDFSSEEEKDRFDIRHMKEGRMKGQAFITLPSDSKAKRALKDVHGYILHGKPMVIQFARSAKAKETS